MSKPSTARDAVAVLAVIVAFFTRTQFVLLAVVLPVAVASFELRASTAGRRRRGSAAGSLGW